MAVIFVMNLSRIFYSQQSLPYMPAVTVNLTGRPSEVSVSTQNVAGFTYPQIGVLPQQQQHFLPPPGVRADSDPELPRPAERFI